MKNILLFLVLVLPVVEAYDMSLTPAFSTILESGVIEHIFRIENLEHETGMNNHILVQLNYTLTGENLSYQNSSEHLINKFTLNTPKVEVGNATSIHLCGTLLANVSETTLTNNQGCWSIFRPGFEPEEESENMTIINETVLENETSISVNTTEHTDNLSSQEENTNTVNCTPIQILGLPQVSETGEQLSYTFSPWEVGDEVSYWIEDLFGNTIKTAVSTTSASKRTYTPRISKEIEVLVIKSRRTREGCEESSDEHMTIITGDNTAIEKEEELTYDDELDITASPDTLQGGKVSSYTLHITKSDNRLRVISTSLMKKSSKLRIKEAGEYHIDIPIIAPYACGKDEHEEDLVVSGLGDEVSVPLLISYENCADTAITQLSSTPFISSLYVRAEKYQPSITLYGKSLGGHVGILQGSFYETDLEPGSFSLPINVTVGNNSLVLLREQNGSVEAKKIHFYLRGEPAEIGVTKEPTKKYENLTVPGSTTFLPPTGNVIVEEKESQKSNVFMIGGIILSGIVISLIIKGKHLRRKKHYVEHHG